MSEETKDRSMQMETAIKLLSDIIYRNPEIMAYGTVFPLMQEIIVHLFLEVVGMRSPGLTDDELDEVWKIVVVDYMVKADEIKKETPDRIKTANDILTGGAEWNGTSDKFTN